MDGSNLFNQIDITDIEGVRVGSAQDDDAKTGVTVLVFDEGARVGIDVSGGGPAARETHLADPTTADNPANAIMLAGGSAFGLAAADGVMHYLEERGMGYDTGYARVPLVLGSCLYDLAYGSADVRPDADMGYEACVNAEANAPKSGDVGAGCGATVGKICGMERASTSPTATPSTPPPWATSRPMSTSRARWPPTSWPAPSSTRSGRRRSVPLPLAGPCGNAGPRGLGADSWFMALDLAHTNIVEVVPIWPLKRSRWCKSGHLSAPSGARGTT